MNAWNPPDLGPYNFESAATAHARQNSDHSLPA